METPLKLLIVEDSEDDAVLVVASLRRSEFAVDYRIVETEDELREALTTGPWDAVITDYSLPAFNGLDAIRIVTKTDLDLPIIIVSGAIGEDVAVAAMRAGAHDYIMKDNLARLGAAMRRELEEADVRHARREAEAALHESEARYRAIVEDQTDLVVRWKPDGTRIYVNRAYRTYFARRRGELIGSNLLDQISAADRPKVLHKIATLAPHSPVFLDERRVLTPEGDIAWHEWADRGIFDEHGSLIEIQSVGRDITERRRVSEAERQQLLLVEVLRDTAAALSSTLDLDEVFDRILANLGWVIPHDASAIFLVSENKAKIVRLRGWEELGFENIPSEIPLTKVESKAFDAMIDAGRPLVIQDTAADPHWRSNSRRLGWVKSFAAAPLFDESRMLGIMALFCQEKVNFSPTHMELLEGFASHAATAVRNARLFETVSHGQSELRKLSARIVEAQEEERRRISRELHDEIGQTLSAMILNVDFIINQYDERIPAQARERLEDIADLSKLTLEQIRGLSLRLRPAMLDELGLAPTLGWLVNGFTNRTGMGVQLDVEAIEGVRLGETLETTLYRAVQEALTNVVRHAQASSVTIQISMHETDVTLVIEDDGRGFATEKMEVKPGSAGGLGLLGMAERIGHLHGALEIQSQPGEGTRFTITIPFELDSAEVVR